MLTGVKLLKIYEVGPIEYWLAEAATQFINGALSGIKLGGLIGGGTGGVTAFSPVGDGLPALKQVILSLSTFIVTMMANGVSQFVTWHANHPFPNPWPEPPQDGTAI